MKTILCTTPINHLVNLKQNLKNYGRLIYKPNISEKQITKLLMINKKIDFIFCNPNRQGYILNKKILNNSSIKLINTASTGLNHINLNDCKKLGIKILSLTKDYKLLQKLPSTSELSFGLMICLLRNVLNSVNSVKKNNWDYLPFMGQEISSLKLGLVGLGRLGKIMANYGKSFGMKVYFYDPYVKSNKFNKVSLKQLFQISDVVSIHAHVNKKTIYLINKKLLILSKKKLIIINTSRGEIVNERDIVWALKNKKIYGYGADVVENEFDNIKNSVIIKNMNKLNILVTPHIGGMTIQGQQRAWNFAVQKFKKYL